MRSSFHLAGLALLGSLAVLSPSLSQGSVIPAIKNLAPFKAFKALEAREGTGIDGMGFASIILAVVDFLKDQNAYDESVPDKCILYMSTTNGGNCNVGPFNGPLTRRYLTDVSTGNRHGSNVGMKVLVIGCPIGTSATSMVRKSSG